MSNWFEEVRAKTDFIIEAIKKHPFIIELMNGSLSKDVFEFYINQDALYLAEYKKILALTGTKCTNSEDAQFFLDSATGIIAVESALHQLFLKGVPFTNEPSPTCELYTSYLTRIVHNHSLEEGLAAVLPCFTIYHEVGNYILANQTGKKDNPYQEWIHTYGGEAFAASVKNAIEITNKHAQNASPIQLQKMELAFEKASKLEWMFWDSAYKQEPWRV
ncbi:thiaminase II [Ascidiimonas aurantiaca]|uniref:thiaminase II n=1 Tax=Ascidiimonas aurantiaca TaxID=1685432 RepID=UPI0030EF767A